MNARPHPFIRPCTVDDIDWMVTLARTHYDGLFDEPQARLWVTARLKNSDMIFYRSENAFAVGHLAKRFNAPDRLQAFLTLLYAAPKSGLEAYFVLQALASWAKDKGATKLWIGDSTGHDLGVFVKRLGGRLAGHTYVLDLDANPNPHG